MDISQETRAELRRLDRELSECLDLLEGSDDPTERFEMASRRADRDQAAGKVIIPLLDALDEAERERDHREAQLKLTQELLARAHETIKRMEGEAWKAAAASELLRGALRMVVAYAPRPHQDDWLNPDAFEGYRAAYRTARAALGEQP